MKSVIASVSLLSVSLLGTPALSAPRNADGLPSVVFSTAEDYSAGTLSNGPLFDKAKAALLLAHRGEIERFSEQLTSTAELTLRKGIGESTPLSAAAIKAAFDSCVGPLPYDEGGNWVQFSLICRTDSAAPIAGFLSFRESAEVNVSVWFDGEKIKEIIVMETIPIPGKRGFGMGVIEPTWTRK